MAEKKEKEELVEVYVPLDQLNPENVYKDIWFNFEGIRIKRGEFVKIPKKYAEILQESLKAEEKLSIGSLRTD